MLVMFKIRFDFLNIRLGKKYRLAFAVQEKAGRISAFPGIVLDTQFAGSDDMGPPGVQTNRTHRLAAKRPGSLQIQILVQLYRRPDLIQLPVRNHIRIPLIQYLHHIEAITQQSGTFYIFQFQHPGIAAGHMSNGFDQNSRPDMIAIINRLVDAVQFVEVVRGTQLFYFCF